MTPLLPLLAALALAPTQAGELTLTEVRTTFGELGAKRSDTAFLPGDVMFIAFDVEGITIDKEGKVSYSMGMEAVDDKGKPFFRQEPIKKADFVPLGGGKLPARAFIRIGLDQPPGKCTLKVNVTDNISKKTKSLEREFEVKPKGFGIVAVYTSVDERGQIAAPTTGVAGQSVFLQFGVVGFDRGGKENQPNITVEMMPYDEAGKATMETPSSFTLESGVDAKDPGFSIRFLLPMTREGNYTVRLKAIDKIANKTATFELPIRVVSPTS